MLCTKVSGCFSLLSLGLCCVNLFTLVVGFLFEKSTLQMFLDSFGVVYFVSLCYKLAV